MKIRHLVMPVVFLFLLMPGSRLAGAADDSAGRQAEWYEDIDVPDEGDEREGAPDNGDLSVFERWQRRFGAENSAGKPAPVFSVSGTVSAATDQSPVLEFLKKTDQSTPYAWDPVGSGKELVNERLVKPLQRGDGTSARPSPRFPQENTIDINVRRPSEMSFYERNAPKVKQLVGDPKMSDGSMEILSTLQTIQHLINCKRAGTDPRVCAREYLINKGAARAVFEVLKYTGLVTHGVVFSLVYADYQAIKNIMKAHEVTSAMWDDYQQALRQQKDNDQSDMANWDGRLDHLRVRTELFADRYVTVQEEIGNHLLLAWAEADDRVKAAQQARSSLEQALEKYRANDFADRLKAACQRNEEGQSSAAGGRDCRSVIERAMAQTSTGSRLITEVGMDPLLREELVARFSAACTQVDTRCNTAREAIRREVSEPSELGELLTLVTDAEQAVEQADGHLVEYEHNARLIRGRLKNLSGFLRSRIEDLHWPDAEERRRAVAMVDTMEQRVTGFQPSRMRFATMAGYRQAIDNMKSDLSYLEEMPRRIIAERDRQLAALEAAGEQVAGDSDDGGCGEVERLTECIDHCKQLDRRYRECLANTSYRQAHEVLGRLQESGCPYAGDIVLQVVVPSVVGKNEAEAKGIMAEHGLALHLDATRTPDREEAQRGITSQIPAAGREVDWGTGVDGRIFIFDESAPPTVCVELKGRYRSHLVSKQPDFGQGEQVLAKAEELDCFWTAGGREHLAASRARYEQFVREEAAETERLCREHYTRYKEAMVSAQPDFVRAEQILDQAADCEWLARAKSHFEKSREKYDQAVAQRDERQREFCATLRNDYRQAMATASPDFVRGEQILGQAGQCDWLNQARDHLARTKQAYNEALDRHRQREQRCDELASSFQAALARSDQSLDPSELKSILASSQSCSWQVRWQQMMPCVEGEYGGLRAYNSGDLATAEHWSQWGQEHGCNYTARLNGLISQAASLRQQQRQQQQATFWDNFAQGLDQYNRQQQALMQQQLNSYAEQAIRQSLQQQSSPTQPPSAQQVRVAPPPPVSGANECAQMNAQFLARCQAGNTDMPEAFSSRWHALGCQVSPQVNQCVERVIRESIGEILPKDWSKVKNVPHVNIPR